MRSFENRRLKLYRGTWCVVWREAGTTKRHSLRTKDRGQAERNFAEYVRQLEKKPGTVSEILDLWAEKKKHLRSMETAKLKFRPLKEFFGNLIPDQITEDVCNQYIEETRKGKKSTTIRNELSVLRCAVNSHDRHNKAVFKFPSTPPPKEGYLTREEAGRLVDAAKAPHLKLFIILALTTGGRITALLELKWDRVDFERGEVDLRTEENKGKRRVVAPMNLSLRKALSEAYEARTSDYVIEFGGKPIKSVHKAFAQCAARAGVTASPHLLRHTAAVWMAEAGVPMSEISQYLGHGSTAITERVYARYSPTYLQKAASALNL